MEVTPRCNVAALLIQQKGESYILSKYEYERQPDAIPLLSQIDMAEELWQLQQHRAEDDLGPLTDCRSAMFGDIVRVGYWDSTGHTWQHLLQLVSGQALAEHYSQFVDPDTFEDIASLGVDLREDQWIRINMNAGDFWFAENDAWREVVSTSGMSMWLTQLEQLGGFTLLARK